MKYYWYGEMIFEIKIYTTPRNHCLQAIQTLGSLNIMRYHLLLEWQYYHLHGELKIHETYDKMHIQLRQQNITFYLVQVPSMV